MTISGFSDRVKNELAGLYETGEINALIKHLLQERLNFSFFELSHKSAEELPADQERQLLSDLERLKAGEPVQYILGYAWFNELKILVDKRVLIPRPETEELMLFIQEQRFPGEAVMLDLCSGSGCIALSLKQAFPDAQVFGADVSGDALDIAKRNSEVLQLPVNWFRWDVLAETGPDVPFSGLDLLVSNPPYVTMDEFNGMAVPVTGFEPHLALFVPDDDPLLFYRRIAGFAVLNLNKYGRVWVEVNRRFAEEVAALFENESLEDVRIYRDLSGNDRFVSAVKV
ncbi:MAG: peptide chain release factor N(5)-glutamine methyltransferase [Bacteroidia bacterium]|nr:peptide chain release factor N(5)-glutamine methyltransferase [Bacteroidia bacterium]